METRLIEDLGKMINELKSYVLVNPKQWDASAGGCNFFAKTKLNCPFTKNNHSYRKLPIAITKLKYPKNYRRICEGIQLLKQYEVDLTFIHSYLFYGVFGKISLLANSDLLTFLEKNNKKINIKEWFAQLILAVDGLHSRGIIHRDIKLENILVFINKKNNIKLKLADLDDITTENDMQLQPAGTSFSFPPEICTASWSRYSPDNKIDPQKYKLADKKAIDCYTLGVAFLLIADPIKLQDHGIRSLLEALLTEDPKKRLTVEGAKEHFLFGEKNKDRVRYFATIKEKFVSEEFFIEGYYLPPNSIPDENDAFIILPRSLKNIYITASSLYNQILSIVTMPDQPHHYFDRIMNCYVNESVLMTIKNKAKKLIDETEAYDEENVYFIRNLNTLTREILAAIEELSILRMKLLSTDRLLIAAEYAVNLYTQLNQPNAVTLGSGSYTFFAVNVKTRHGQYGINNATEFLKKLKKMRPNTSPRALFEYILDYLEKGPGNHYPHSFKTILKKELEAISSQPFDQWIPLLSNNENDNSIILKK